MKQHVNKTYTSTEMMAAIQVLTQNKLHNFHPGDAQAIIQALHKEGFRVVKITEKEKK